MTVDLLILNRNGRELLARCLPSVLAAVKHSRYRIAVWVVDNSSTDGSREFLRQVFPEVRVWHRPNRGACSFNDVLARLPGRIAVLMNNDIIIARDCLDRLLAPLLPPGESVAQEPVESEAPTDPSGVDRWHPKNRIAQYYEPPRPVAQDLPPGVPVDPNLFMTAARLMTIDGRDYEGQKTAVDWHQGLISATSLFSGAQRVAHLADGTAAAGSLVAMDRAIFLQVGGFDPVYLPGRLEDVDLAFRAYLCGWHARYVPQAVGYHIGGAMVNPRLGLCGEQRLAWRNTLIFQWRNLRHPWHRMQTWAWLPWRLLTDCLAAPWRPRGLRFGWVRAFVAALAQCWKWRHNRVPRRMDWGRERLYFDRFSASRLSDPTTARRPLTQYRVDPAHTPPAPQRRWWQVLFGSGSASASDGPRRADS